LGLHQTVYQNPEQGQHQYRCLVMPELVLQLAEDW